MAWPQANEFQEAVQNPRLAFSDPELQAAKVGINALELPHGISGQFGIVYEMKAADGRRWAVKCFTGPSSDRQRRYQAIGARLREVNLRFMVGFDYLEQGIRIQGKWYPILKMEWVEGQTLNQFIGQNLDKPLLLKGLVVMWLKVAQRLRELDVTHADLQHGNVMLVPGKVEGKVSLKLVDYDGIYLPTVAGLPSGELGHRDFQHPKRLATNYYGPEVDRFSHLVICTALQAVREMGKSVWDKYSSGDNLLFTQADFETPGDSKILRDCWANGSDDLRALTGRLLLATNQALKDLPHLSDVLTEGGVLPLSAEQIREVDRSLGFEKSHGNGGGLAPKEEIPDDLYMRSIFASFAGYQMLEHVADLTGASIYRASHLALNQTVMLRLLDFDFEPADNTTAYLNRAQAASAFEHPHVQLTLDVGIVRHRPYIVHEEIDGVNLATLVNEIGAMPTFLACEYIRQAASALQAAAERGIFHGDFSPAKLLVTPVTRKPKGTEQRISTRPAPGAVVKVMDLGLIPLRPPLGEISPSDTAKLGEFAFAAPERLTRSVRNAAADLWSLGASMYFMLAGRTPFPSTSAVEFLQQLRYAEPLRIDKLRPDLPGELAEFIHQLLSRDPSRRPVSAGAVAQFLASYCQTSAK